MVVCCMTGCNKTSDTVDENTEKACIVPEISEDIFVNIKNADMTFAKGMPMKEFNFDIYSRERLDTEKIEITFDTDVEYSCEQLYAEEVATVEDGYGYALLCAYNDIQIKKAQENQNLTFEDYNKVVEEDKIADLYYYTYIVICKMEEKEIPEDVEINNINIKYKEREYNYNIGSIKFDYVSETYYKFAKYLAGNNSAIVPSNGLSYYPLDRPNEIYFDSVLTTLKKEVIITDISFSNVKDMEMDKAVVYITNDEGTIQSEFEKGTELVIPKNSQVNFSLFYTMKNPNKVGYCCVPELNVKYKIGKKEGRFDYSMIAYSFETLYENYAYNVDGIDIFNLYMNYK